MVRPVDEVCSMVDGGTAAESTVDTHPLEVYTADGVDHRHQSGWERSVSLASDRGNDALSTR